MIKLRYEWLNDTLGNEEWLHKNETALKEVLPETWTHMGNVNMPQIGFRLKLLGVDFRTIDQLAEAMASMEQIKLLIREGYTVRRNPHPIFKETANAGHHPHQA